MPGATQPSAATPARHLICVVGMHRSGTSMTMQALRQLGAQPGGALLEGDTYNPNGYWEAAEVVDLHDRLLEGLHRRWGTPEHALPIPAEWFSTQVARDAVDEIARIVTARLASVADGAPLAIKDPRSSLFLPLWREAAARLGVRLSAVMCVRHPAEVAASLARRDRIEAPMAGVLWAQYQAATIAGLDGSPALVSVFADWHRDPHAMMARLADFLDLPVGADSPFEAAITTALQPDRPADPVVADWWDRLQAEAAGAGLSPEICGFARQHLAMAQHLATVTQAVRAEIGATPASVLLRDLESYRSTIRDLQALRSGDQDWIARQDASIQTLQAERADLVAAADRLHDAYATTAAERHALTARLDEMSTAYTTAAARGEELHAAYTTAAAQAADYRTAYLAETEQREAAQTAYRIETEQREALQQASARAAADAESYRAAYDEYRAAYDASAAQAADLAAACQRIEAERARLERTLRRFKPWTWRLR